MCHKKTFIGTCGDWLSESTDYCGWVPCKKTEDVIEKPQLCPLCFLKMQNNEIKILEQELIELQKSSEELQQEERFLEATRADNECKYVARKLQIRRQYFRDALAATEGGSQNLLERIDEELERRQMERRLSEIRADEKLEQDLAADDALVPSFISPWDFPPFDYPSDCPRLSQSPER